MREQRSIQHFLAAAVVSTRSEELEHQVGVEPLLQTLHQDRQGVKRKHALPKSQEAPLHLTLRVGGGQLSYPEATCARFVITSMGTSLCKEARKTFVLRRLGLFGAISKSISYYCDRLLQAGFFQRSLTEI